MDFCFVLLWQNNQFIGFYYAVEFDFISHILQGIKYFMPPKKCCINPYAADFSSLSYRILFD